MTEGFNTQRDEKTDSRHNLTWHMMDINRQKREKQMQQKAFTIWMSGLSGAGKSTIIKNLIKEMSPIGGNIYIKGREISDYTSKEYAKTMSVVLTEKIKTEMMTCRDVVAMGRYPYTN